MNFTSARAEYIPQKPGWQGIYEKVEVGARTCYKSEGKTEYDENGNSITAELFADKILKVYKHHSVAEHATIYLTFVTDRFCKPLNELWEVFITGPVSKYSVVKRKVCYDEEYIYVTTNLRVLIENNLVERMKPYMVEPTEHHEKQYSIRIFTDRGVSAEANRHRTNSPSERSTRYVDSQGGLTVMMPDDYKEPMQEIIEFWGDKSSGFSHPLEYMCNGILFGELHEWTKFDWWYFANLACERAYREMRELGCEKQEARRILPMDIETELVITASETNWKHFFDLRLKGTTGTPHPDMRHIARLMALELKEVMPWLEDYL